MSMASGNPPRLLDQVREVIRIRHYKAYCTLASAACAHSFATVR
jgi:hypothetical protein